MAVAVDYQLRQVITTLFVITRWTIQLSISTDSVFENLLQVQ